MKKQPGALIAAATYSRFLLRELMRINPRSTYVLYCVLGVFALSIFPATALAQKGVSREEFYSIDDGLSDRLINDMLQDDNGLVWIATPNGLNRFDGYEFIGYNNHPDNEFAISATNVERLEKDAEGNLVVFYQNNKVFFDILNPRTNELQKVRLSLEDGIKGFVRTIYVSRAGRIYLLSVHEDGTHVYQCSPLEEEHLELLFRIPEIHSSVTPAIDLVELNDGSFLINDSELGLRLFTRNGALLKSFQRYDFDLPATIQRYPAPAQFMHIDQQGKVWLSLSQVRGIFNYNVEKQLFEQAPGLPPQDNYTKIWEDRSGNVLLAQSEVPTAYSELEKLHCVRRDGSAYDFSYLKSINPYINTAYANDFFQTIFLGIETGLSIVQNNRSKIKTYLTQDMDEHSRSNFMRGIDGDGNGTIYIANQRKYWYALDLSTNYIDTLQVVNERTGRPVYLNNCMDIQLDGRSNLWGISVNYNGQGLLHRYNLEWCTTRTFTFPHPFAAFTQSSDGKLWLICQPENEKGYLVSFDPQSARFDIFRDKEGKNPLKNSTPFYILEGQNELLWIGTDNGLYAIDREPAEVQTFRPQSDNQSSIGLSSNTIYVIHQDSSGHLWLGTNNGLNILDPETQEVRTLDKRNGMASNTVYGILPDGRGNYWVTTFYGLSYYEPAKNQFRNFYAEDGLSNDEFNRFSFYHDTINDRFYFGGVNGLNAFTAQDLLVNDSPPPVVLTKMTRYNSRQDSLIDQCTPLCKIDEVEVSPYDIYFQFHFMLPNFSSPRKNQFKAWLEGYEKDWIYLGNTPNIRYSKLPPGRYTLHIKGADPNGNWSKQAVSINIRVRPIFYKTWWFLTLGGLFIVGIIYSILRYQLEQKLKVERLRTKLSSDIHDEVSGLLAGIAMQTDVLQEFVQDELSKKKLRTIGEKSRKAMSKMSDVIWSIDSRNDKVEDLLLRMREHADEILHPLGIQYQFHVNKLESSVKIPVKIRQELYFIFKEAVNNIAKHANATRVDIDLVNNGNLFEMIIHDNGAGTHKINGKTGQGLANIRMRAQRIDANLNIFNGDGYTVELKMKKFA